MWSWTLADVKSRTYAPQNSGAAKEANESSKTEPENRNVAKSHIGTAMDATEAILLISKTVGALASRRSRRGEACGHGSNAAGVEADGGERKNLCLQNEARSETISETKR